MSDLNDDLLNYELGDDIDDQALYGADEDELLLSDDELETVVTNEVKQQLKAEAEQWVQSQIQDHQLNNAGCSATSNSNIGGANTPSEAIEANVEVTSSAPSTGSMGATHGEAAVSTSEEYPVHNQYAEFKQPPNQEQQLLVPSEQLQVPNHQTSTHTDEVSSSSSLKFQELELEHSSVISCSTGVYTDPSFIQSSQESFSAGTAISGEFSDPREDPDDEREERTNIKITSEREFAHMVGLSPDKNHPRFGHSKRGGNPFLRSSGPYFMRGGPYPGMRPLLRYPSHGNFPLIAHFRHLQPLALPQPLERLLPSDLLPSIPSTKTNSSLIPGQFPPQQQQPPNPFVTHSPGSIGANATSATQSQQQHHLNTHPHLHDPNNHVHHPAQLKQRHPFPSYRVGGPGGFRPGPTGMYPSGPRDYSPGSGAPQFNLSYGLLHPPRGPIYRPEIPGAPCMRPGLRMQRPPHGMPMNPGAFGNNPHIRHPQTPSLQITPVNASAAGTGVGNAPNVSTPTQSAPPSGNSMQPASVRPSKVLINPNFKGGVEAATSKFIKETQFMSTISSHVSHLQSDEELLRQQEEFITKNRQHIEKRRNERSPLPIVRRSRSRSHTRERSYSPKRSAGGIEAPASSSRHFERERERERERDRVIGVGGVGSGGPGERFIDRERERERDRGVKNERPGRASSRDRERERDRPGTGYGNGVSNANRGNRFRRANSRDRDYENRSGAVNYAKRRRSFSPLPIRGGRRGGDRDRNDVEEDEETRVYRLEIEKQKALREKILRDKEMRRRRAAEVKLHEDKPATPGGNTNEDHPQPHKLKPIIVTESKIISLKKKQQRHNEDNSEHYQHPIQQQLRKQIPTAKILPEAKRTLSEHLTNAGGANSATINSNTAIIKPVLKLDTMSSTPPTTAVVAPTGASLASKYTRHVSSPSDDEFELDYDEDELMLDEEDRLLASPTPPPQQQLPRTRTPTPEPIKPPSIKSNNYNSSSSNASSRNHQSNQKPLTTANRRVVLKSSSSGSRREDGSNSTRSASKSRHSSSNHRDNHSRDGGVSNSYSKGIFERLDARSKMSEASNNKSQRKSQQQRIVMKNN